jgi:hypothetical protein
MKETVGIVMMNIMGIITKIIMKIMMIAANRSIATREGREKQPGFLRGGNWRLNWRLE